MLKLYNTLTRKKETFQPLKNKKAGIYTCGPTVYDYAHIGNLRSFIFADILQHSLKYSGYQVTWIMNITDVDDKTIKWSKEKYPDLPPMEALIKFTQEYEKIFWRDLEKLNIQKPNKIPHATEFIPQMQELIVKIIKAGYGYEQDGSFYFNVSKYAKDYKYGQLIKLDLKKLKTGTRVLSDEYEKEEIQDFVLWKVVKQGEPGWDFIYKDKTYPGRPGWHIECSAMSQEYLGVPFDIHTGGVDLKFPHHENEIAQSCTGYCSKKLATFFLYNEHVLVDNQKMAKRLKNFYTLNDLEKKKFNPLAYRYFVLNSHYRSKLNFTWEGLKASQNALENLYEHYRVIARSDSDEGQLSWPKQSREKTAGLLRSARGDGVEKYKTFFLSAINDDLNTPQALAVMWETIKDKSMTDIEKKNLLLEFDKIFGLGLLQLKPRKITIPKDIKKLVVKREQLRKQKNWQEADKIRKEIEKLGYKIEDTEKEPKIIKQ